MRRASDERKSSNMVCLVPVNLAEILLVCGNNLVIVDSCIKSMYLLLAHVAASLHSTIRWT